MAGERRADKDRMGLSKWQAGSTLKPGAALIQNPNLSARPAQIRFPGVLVSTTW
jgi:hypothetical protein